MVRWETPRICERSARSTARSCAIWVSFPVGRPLRTAPIAWVVVAGVTEAWRAICPLLSAKCLEEATATTAASVAFEIRLARVAPRETRGGGDQAGRYCSCNQCGNNNAGGRGSGRSLLFQHWLQPGVYQSHAEPGEVLHIARDHGKVMLQGSSGDHSIRRVERTPG